MARTPAIVERARVALRRADRYAAVTGDPPGVTAEWVADSLGVASGTARVALTHLVDSGEVERFHSPLNRQRWLYRMAPKAGRR